MWTIQIVKDGEWGPMIDKSFPTKESAQRWLDKSDKYGHGRYGRVVLRQAHSPRPPFRH